MYLAGKMKGLPDLGRKHFRSTEIALVDSGHIVLNPGVLPLGMPEEKYLPICLAMLMQADAVLMLEGWQDSAGAVIENAFATYLGKRVYFEGECEELWNGGVTDGA